MNSLVAKKRFWMSVVALAAVALLAAYVWVYQAGPFSPWVNRAFLNAANVLLAGFGGCMAALVARYFQPDEPGRWLWVSFSAALWSWALGDTVWGVFNVLWEVVPDLSWADPFWGLGYVFFFLAMLRQYELIFPHRKRFLRGLMAILVSGGALLALGILAALGEGGSFENYLAILYPIADLELGILAVILVMTFHRGWLARPWLGLLVFVVSDTLYILTTSLNLYDFSMREDLVSLVVDAMYIVAYIAVGWGIFQHYLFVWLGSQATLEDGT
jgi:hypothetical protein